MRIANKLAVTSPGLLLRKKKDEARRLRLKLDKVYAEIAELESQRTGVCRYCGKSIEGKRWDARYCSTQCKWQGYYWGKA